MGLTSVSTVATGDTITASVQNTMRDNDLVLDARTGGDPAVTGRLLRSNGATSAVWVAALTAITEALGYTPLKNTTDTLTGTLTATGLSLGALGALINGAGGINVIGGGGYNGGSTGVGEPDFLGISVGASGIDSTGPYDGGSKLAGDLQLRSLLLGALGLLSEGNMASDGTVTGFQLVASVANGSSTPIVIDPAQANVTVPNLKAALAALAQTISDGAVSTTAKLADGVVTSAKIADGTITGTDIAAATVAASNIVPATITNTQIASATIIDGNVAAANKDGLAATPSLRTLGTGAQQAAAGDHAHANMALSASGAYTGNGSATRNITVGFAPKKVTIIRTDVHMMWTSLGNATVSIQHNVGANNGSVGGLTFGATTFQVTTTSGTNTNLGTYIWVAEG